MKKRKPLTEAQKEAQKIRQKIWCAANKEKIAERQRAYERKVYAELKAKGGEEYEAMLEKKAAQIRNKKAKMTPEQLLELQEKESARWKARKADPIKYKAILENKRGYVARIKEDRPEQYEKIKGFKRDWWKNNKAHGLSLVRARQARLVKACPDWADTELIRRMYVVAERFSAVTGIQHHVDHVIPLKGKLVSGLHVHNNLRVVAYDVNVSKSNHYEV